MASLASTVLYDLESSATFADGHLVFHRQGTLMAQPFDPVARAPVADAFPIANNVATEGSRYGSFSMADTGALLYARGSDGGQLTWHDRSGHPTTVVGESENIFLNLALSPDERYVAAGLTGSGGGNREVWVFNSGSNRAPTRLTFEPDEDHAPVWAPDGKRIVYYSQRGPSYTLRSKSVDSLAADEAILEVSNATGSIVPTSWSSDGRYILYNHTEAAAGGQANIWALPLFGDRKPFPYIATPVSEFDGSFSPDGRWVAYSAAESGQPEVFMQPFPATGAKFQISHNGGFKPVWSRDGKELFYLEPEGRLMSIAIRTTPTFEAGTAQPLFTTTLLGFGGAGRQYDVTRNGKQFIVNLRPQHAGATPLTLVTNWRARLAQN